VVRFEGLLDTKGCMICFGRSQPLGPLWFEGFSLELVELKFLKYYICRLFDLYDRIQYHSFLGISLDYISQKKCIYFFLLERILYFSMMYQTNLSHVGFELSCRYNFDFSNSCAFRIKKIPLLFPTWIYWYIQMELQ
jgi:hypothetical protein